MRVGLIVAAVLIAPAARATCFEPRVGPRNALSVRLPTLFSHGAGLQYERFLPIEGSVAFGLAYRRTAGGDYRSDTFVASSEIRTWFLSEAPFSCLGRYAMVGPFLSLRLDVGRTGLRDVVEDRPVGVMWHFAASSWLGVRVTIGRVEITPAAATMVRLDTGGRLATMITPTFAYALTVGWMF